MSAMAGNSDLAKKVKKLEDENKNLKKGKTITPKHFSAKGSLHSGIGISNDNY